MNLAASSRTTDVDLAIVGNGAVGCALALHLTEHEPDARIALAGPSARTGSASLAAAAMLNVFAEADATAPDTDASRAKLAIALEAARAWGPHLALLNRRIGDATIDPVRVRLGTYVVHTGAPGSLGAATYDLVRRRLEEHGEPFEDVDPLVIHGLAHDATTPRRALHIPHEGMVSARDLLRAYDEAFARTRGLVVVDGAVRTLLEKGGSFELTIGEDVVVRARRVVLAAGAETQPLLDGAGLAAKIPRLVAGVGASLVLDVADPPRKVIRMIGDEPTGGPYAVPYGPDRLYLGATSQIMAIAPETAPTEALDTLRATSARQIHPRLRRARVVATLLGARPTTLDGYPLLGATSLEGIWIASGTRRDGLHLSPRIAEEFTRCLAAGGPATQPFGGRFAPERPLLLELPRAEAVDRTIASLGAVEPEASRLVEEVYADCGLASSEHGIPVELFEMYRAGLATENLGHYHAAQKARAFN